MNKKMFKKIAHQANIKIDTSSDSSLLPNSIKMFKINETYYAYQVDKDSNKKLIIETEKENDVYKAIVKHLGIKLDKRGDVRTNNNTKKRS